MLTFNLTNNIRKFLDYKRMDAIHSADFVFFGGTLETSSFFYVNEAVQLDENPTVTVEEVSIKEPTDGELIDEEPTDEELIDEETRRIIENEDWRHNIQEVGLIRFL